jgi:hypothetical protein
MPWAGPRATHNPSSYLHITSLPRRTQAAAAAATQRSSQVGNKNNNNPPIPNFNLEEKTEKIFKKNKCFLFGFSKIPRFFCRIIFFNFRLECGDRVASRGLQKFLVFFGELFFPVLDCNGAIASHHVVFKNSSFFLANYFFQFWTAIWRPRRITCRTTVNQLISGRAAVVRRQDREIIRSLFSVEGPDEKAFRPLVQFLRKTKKNEENFGFDVFETTASQLIPLPFMALITLFALKASR